MFKQIFRLTFITFIWKQYKRTIVSTFSLLVFLWLINFAHREYLSFAEHQSDASYISLSFFIKWILLVAAVIIYLCYSLYSPKNIHSLDKNKVDKKSAELSTLSTLSNADDPFAQIRQKKNLRSRADIMLERHTRNK